MNNNYNQNNGEQYGHYKASGNLNTLISNPSVNINDTMNVNIQNVSTPNTNVIPEINNNLENEQNSYTKEGNNSNVFENQVNKASGDNSKQYVSIDNRPKKKKTISIKIGPEFKTVLLIVVVLLVFIFLFPTISNLFNK